MGDAEVVAALRSGDEATFARLVEAWGPVMRQLARRHVGDDATADDVVQETWVGILRGLERFEGRSSLRTWAFRILLNTAKATGVRDHRVTPLGPAVETERFFDATGPYPGHWRSLPAAWPTPEDAAEAADVRRVVGSALGKLPDRQRVVVTLRDVHGWTADEVCALLEVSPGHQRVLLHRGRAALRAALEVHYGAGAGVER